MNWFLNLFVPKEKTSKKYTIKELDEMKAHKLISLALHNLEIAESLENVEINMNIWYESTKRGYIACLAGLVFHLSCSEFTKVQTGIFVTPVFMRKLNMVRMGILSIIFSNSLNLEQTKKDLELQWISYDTDKEKFKAWLSSVIDVCQKLDI